MDGSIHSINIATGLATAIDNEIADNSSYKPTKRAALRLAKIFTKDHVTTEDGIRALLDIEQISRHFGRSGLVHDSVRGKFWRIQVAAEIK